MKRLLTCGEQVALAGNLDEIGPVVAASLAQGLCQYRQFRRLRFGRDQALRVIEQDPRFSHLPQQCARLGNLVSSPLLAQAPLAEFDDGAFTIGLYQRPG